MPKRRKSKVVIVESAYGRDLLGRITYQLELVRCGKERCRACGRGYAHGPYWYAYRKEGGRLRKRYVGKELPAEAKRGRPR